MSGSTASRGREPRSKIYLPGGRGEGPGPPAARLLARWRSTARTILVVEDEPTVRADSSPGRCGSKATPSTRPPTAGERRWRSRAPRHPARPRHRRRRHARPRPAGTWPSGWGWMPAGRAGPVHLGIHRATTWWSAASSSAIGLSWPKPIMPEALATQGSGAARRLSLGLSLPPAQSGVSNLASTRSTKSSISVAPTAKQ